jgi:hypothetical protein
MAKILHIVSFNIPYPADYGGVIDVYYKIKALKESGVEIILHCFEYGRKSSDKLNEICKEVHYYKRPKNFRYAIKNIPFIVATRNSPRLKENLLKDNFPILFEGLHSTLLLHELADKNRKLVVRTHNIEHDYYKGLSNAETKYFKKIFFNSESKKLLKYESVLKNVSHIATISLADQQYFNSKYGHSTLIPAFHPYDKVNIKQGKGDYVLFHGDLSVSDNVRSVLFLMNEVFNSLHIPFVIAGKNPDKKILEVSNSLQNIRVIANPDDEEMDDLLSNAQINILTTFQNAGIKLKLLAALYRGRHCLVNNEMVENTGLDNLCHISTTALDFRNQINEWFNIPFEIEEISRRKLVLEENYSNRNNALKLIEVIFS